MRVQATYTPKFLPTQENGPEAHTLVQNHVLVRCHLQPAQRTIADHRSHTNSLALPLSAMIVEPRRHPKSRSRDFISSEGRSGTVPQAPKFTPLALMQCHTATYPSLPPATQSHTPTAQTPEHPLLPVMPVSWVGSCGCLVENHASRPLNSNPVRGKWEGGVARVGT